MGHRSHPLSRARHQKLDTVVFAAYGRPLALSDDELPAKLLALNLERAKKA